ncbi:hypothetical protein CCACVL1_13767 [Corchorus capsularis]|uniref:Uncharacterized protein n=1 Tax=Corchorus capsularis TaxID=210143 RepID=A0A1R3I9N8_COCAP|nr:hypothetical protein CCACVL1_13767 [Corchorus capsularis]
MAMMSNINPEPKRKRNIFRKLARAKGTHSKSNIFRKLLCNNADSTRKLKQLDCNT